MGNSIDTARAAWSQQRHDETASLREAVAVIVRSGVTTLGGIAKALQAQGVRTSSGASKWHRAQVARLIADNAAASGSSETAPSLAKMSAKVSSPPADKHLNDGLNDAARILPTAPAAETLTNLNRPPSDAVAIEITTDHAFLPTGDDGNVGPGWESAPDTERVKQGRRLMVPRAMAEWLQARRQAVILPPGSPIPVYVRPGQLRP